MQTLDEIDNYLTAYTFFSISKNLLSIQQQHEMDIHAILYEMKESINAMKIKPQYEQGTLFDERLPIKVFTGDADNMELVIFNNLPEHHNTNYDKNLIREMVNESLLSERYWSENEHIDIDTDRLLAIRDSAVREIDSRRAVALGSLSVCEDQQAQ